MKRRSALKYTTALAGVGISTSFIAGVLSGCAPEKTASGYSPVFLNREKFEFLRSFCEVLIPQTNTPGAMELELPEWIDTIVKKCYTKVQQDQVSKDLDVVFHALDGDPDLGKVNSLESAMATDDELKRAYQNTKSTVATAYLANEYVGTKLLNFLPIPGEYEACIPISETNGKAWTI